jgi:hypothetical protein
MTFPNSEIMLNHVNVCVWWFDLCTIFILICNKTSSFLVCANWFHLELTIMNSINPILKLPCPFFVETKENALGLNIYAKLKINKVLYLYSSWQS